MGVASLVLSLLACPTQARPGNDNSADSLLTSQWGIGLNASTFGFGGEIIKGLGPKFDLRAGYSYMHFKIHTELDIQGTDVGLNSYLTAGGPHLLANYNLKKWFHLTLGAAVNQTSVLLSASASSNVPMEDVEILPGDFGLIELMIKPVIKVAPYAGIGFGRTLNPDKRFSFSVDIGTYFHAAPAAYMLGTGMLSPSASEHNSYVINSLIKPFRWWPALNFQLSYRIL